MAIRIAMTVFYDDDTGEMYCITQEPAFAKEQLLKDDVVQDTYDILGEALETGKYDEIFHTRTLDDDELPELSGAEIAMIDRDIQQLS